MNEKLTDRNATLNVERLLKPNEVAEVLNISRSFAYHLLQSEAIPVIRLGKACRVRPKDLADYIENNLHRQSDDH
jgi:excisionase family DNA binding protein